MRSEHPLPHAPSDAGAAWAEPVATAPRAHNPAAYASTLRRRTAARPAASITISAVLAIGVGAVTALLHTGAYTCTAVLDLPKDGLGQATALRDAWAASIGRAPETSLVGNWRVACSAPGAVQLTAQSTSQAAGLAFVRQAAERFIEELRTQQSRQRESASGPEQLAQSQLERLRGQMEDAQKRVEQAAAELPANDPREERTQALTRWNELVAGFREQSRALAAAEDTLSQLEASGAPTHATASPEAREKAYVEDVALQQDLQELQVHLTQIKRLLLDAWQQSAAVLPALREAVDAARKQAAQDRSWLTESEHAGRLAEWTSQVEELDTELATFASAWEQDFVALREVAVDATRDDLLDAQQQLRELLRGYEFSTNKHLEGMRSAAAGFADQPQDARFHVLHADLTRATAAVEQGLSGFVDAAIGVDDRENFRLDAALHSARGLRRRTRAEMAVLEERLAEVALAEARVTYDKQLNLARAEVRAARERTNATIQDLVQTQEALNASGAVSEEFLRNMLAAETAAARMEGLRDEVDAHEQQLERLRHERTADLLAIPKLGSCVAVACPDRARARITMGGWVAAAAFAATMLAQWWVTRGTARR